MKYKNATNNLIQRTVIGRHKYKHDYSNSLEAKLLQMWYILPMRSMRPLLWVWCSVRALSSSVSFRRMATCLLIYQKHKANNSIPLKWNHNKQRTNQSCSFIAALTHRPVWKGSCPSGLSWQWWTQSLWGWLAWRRPESSAQTGCSAAQSRNAPEGSTAVREVMLVCWNVVLLVNT